MTRDEHIPLRHPFIEESAPGPATPKQRAAYFASLGEWPYAVSACLEAVRGGAGPAVQERLEVTRQQWRSYDGDAEFNDGMAVRDFKKLLADIRGRDGSDPADLHLNARSLREAYRRNPDSRVVQDLLSITYLRLLDDGTPAAADAAYRGYHKVEDAGELAARVDELVAARRHVPLWIVVCPNSSGTWQLRDYLLHLQEMGRSRFLIDVHKYRRERQVSVLRDTRRLPWQVFLHLSAHTDLRFVVAGNLHDPVHAIVYTAARKLLVALVRQRSGTGPMRWDAITAEDRETVRARTEHRLGLMPLNDLAGYFHLNYEHAFGLPLSRYQIRHKRRGYFVGFRGNLTLVLTRLRDLDTALPVVLENVLGVDTAGCRPVSDFRVTSDRTLSDHIRAIIEEVSVPQALIERTLDAPFLVEHFLPEQIQGMRDRWLPRSKQPVDRDRPA